MDRGSIEGRINLSGFLETVNPKSFHKKSVLSEAADKDNIEIAKFICQKSNEIRK